MRARILLLALVLLASTSSYALIPPWYYYQRLVSATVGANPCVKVGEPVEQAGNHWMISVTGCNKKTSEALAVFLDAKILGDVVTLLTYDETGSHQSAPVLPSSTEQKQLFLARALNDALDGNFYFVRIYPPTNPLSLTFVELKKEVIQIFSDDLGDLYGCANFVAQDLFARVLRTDFGDQKAQIHFSTAKASEFRARR